MSYRIWLSVLKKNEINEYLKLTEDYFFNQGYCEDSNKGLKLKRFELHDNLDLDKFTPIGRFSEDEYKPYLLDKEDLQYILDYYKEFNMKYAREREKFFDYRKEKLNLKSRDIGMLHIHYGSIANYFESLIKSKENITSSNMYLLDYFKLVDIYNNIQDDEVILITHG